MKRQLGVTIRALITTLVAGIIAVSCGWAQAPTASSTQESADIRVLYQRALDLVGQVTRTDSRVVAKPGTAAALLEVIQRDPNGQYGAQARNLLNSLQQSNTVFPDWDGKTTSVAATDSSAAAGEQQASAVPRQGPVKRRKARRGRASDAQQQSSSASSSAMAQDAQMSPDQARSKIDELQNDAHEQDREAAQWDSTAGKVGDNSSCSGPGAALCAGIGFFGAAKARKNAAKARQRAQNDREQIARLQGIELQHVQIDTSYAGAMKQQQDATGGYDPNAIVNTANQQASQMVAIGVANDAVRQQAAQARTAAPQAAEQQAQQVLQRQQSLQASNTVSATSPGSGITTGGAYAASLDTSCVRFFYNSNNFGWLSFTNNCGQKISLVILVNDNMNVGAGATKLNAGDTGDIPIDQVAIARHGGYSAYVCPYPFNVVDMNNKPIQVNVPKFQCWDWRTH